MVFFLLLLFGSFARKDTVKKTLQLKKRYYHVKNFASHRCIKTDKQPTDRKEIIHKFFYV